MSENKTITIEQAAEICHEVNKAYCKVLGDFSQPSWQVAPDWQKSSAIAGIKFHLENPDAKPSHSHESWLEEKSMGGWKYGPKKDPQKREHPCIFEENIFNLLIKW